ncbi:hypothetical protein NR798_15035 [Archangium gephyra]|uniref:hypothetical protein n=1 Tax=Archangium gephyra TaxID=48 RepID=UPI0035D45A51
MSRGTWAAFVLSSTLLATAPLWRVPPEPSPVSLAFPGWPSTFEGRPLRELPLTEREERFGEGFPGRIGRFTDGQRELIVRWVAAPTRQLHSTEACFRGLGYAISPAPFWRQEEGPPWNRFIVSRGASRMVVREAVMDGRGGHWTDVSAWYWSALLGHSEGPWWAITLAENAPLDAR